MFQNSFGINFHFQFGMSPYLNSISTYSNGKYYFDDCAISMGTFHRCGLKECVGLDLVMAYAINFNSERDFLKGCFLLYYYDYYGNVLSSK